MSGMSPSAGDMNAPRPERYVLVGRLDGDQRQIELSAQRGQRGDELARQHIAGALLDELVDQAEHALGTAGRGDCSAQRGDRLLDPERRMRHARPREVTGPPRWTADRRASGTSRRCGRSSHRRDRSRLRFLRVHLIEAQRLVDRTRRDSRSDRCAAARARAADPLERAHGRRRDVVHQRQLVDGRAVEQAVALRVAQRRGPLGERRVRPDARSSSIVGLALRDRRGAASTSCLTDRIGRERAERNPVVDRLAFRIFVLAR
jgi:hypothetical protein